MSLQSKLTEAVNRYNAINKYVSEQTTPPPVSAGAGTTPDPNADPNSLGASTTMDAGTPPPSMPPAPNDTATAPPPAAAGNSLPPLPAETPVNDTQELDVTDMVNLTKELKTKMDQQSARNEESMHKMDSVFSKLDDLEGMLNQLNQQFNKIDNLEKSIQQMKPLSPEEKLNLRSYDSYPFNQKLSDFFKDKQPEMEMTKKNNYVLTSDDANYNKDEIQKSFDV